MDDVGFDVGDAFDRFSGKGLSGYAQTQIDFPNIGLRLAFVIPHNVQLVASPCNRNRNAVSQSFEVEIADAQSAYQTNVGPRTAGFTVIVELYSVMSGTNSKLISRGHMPERRDRVVAGAEIELAVEVARNR